MIASNTVIGGRYRVTRPLGGGGMKQVYLAEDLRLAARPCALAEMIDNITNPDMQRQAVAAFQREADMLAELSNEHIPRVFDRFSEQNRHYLVMEYVEGTTLEDGLKQAGGKLDPAQVIDIALQVCDTLEYLHGLNPPVIYRDLKPSNVIVTPSGKIKLIDFGIARHFQPLTNATMIGTQGYAPPEQYRGKVESRSDLYALAATMHHALSGRDPALEPPFSFPPLHKLCPQIDQALADVVDTTLAYDVEKRIATASDLKHRLLAIKIETLTGGLVGSSEAAAAIAVAATSTGHGQLKLPLATPPAKTGSAARSDGAPAASVPTLLTTAADTTCSGCGRQIPHDSRFCSYCGYDLRPVAPPSVTGSEDETVLLTHPDERQRFRPDVTYGRRHRFGRRGRRPTWLSLLILFGLAFAAVKIVVALIALGARTTPPPEASVPPGFSEPSDPGTTEPEGGLPDLDRSTRAFALRRLLDFQGYRDVHFKMNGEQIELWGSVPTEDDRAIVRELASAAGGATGITDRLRVSGGSATP